MRLYRFMNRDEIRLANFTLISGRQMHMHQCVHFPRYHNKKKEIHVTHKSLFYHI